jgi:hypothetical protein
VSGIGLSVVSSGRVPNWNAMGPRSLLPIQSFQSLRCQTPPAITIGTLSSPTERMIRRSSRTRGRGDSGLWGSSLFESPLCPPASQGSS